MFKNRNLIFTGLLLVVFVYGIAIGRYRIFPYQQLGYVQDLISGTDKDTGTQSYDGIEIIETSLQRLLLKEVPIEQDYSPELYNRGGAISVVDSFIYISTNRNDSKKENLVVLNTESFTRVDIEGLSVPMSYDELLSSSLMDKGTFPKFLFRVTGIYSEKGGKNQHTLYVSHNEYHEDKQCLTFSVSRVSIDFKNGNASISSEWDTFFRASPCIYPQEDKQGNLSYNGRMSGGSIINYDNNHILVSVGNFLWTGGTPDLKALSMDTSSSFGKLILLNKLNGDYSIFAKGFRNTQGLIRDAYNNIWATDHGPMGGDELNLVKQDENYGWPKVTYGIKYGNVPWPHNEAQGRHNLFTPPVYAWMPSIGISEISRLSELDKFNLWNDDLLIGSMKDKSFYRTRLDQNQQVVYSERIEIGYRIRDFSILSDESLAVLSDRGILVIIDDGGPVFEDLGPVAKARIAALNKFDMFLGESQLNFKNDLASAETIFMQKCSSCHYLKQINGVGPHLHNIFSREIGSIENFNYSTALSSSKQKWSPDLIRDFLLQNNPQFSNSIMPEVELSESEVDSIINYLRIK